MTTFVRRILGTTVQVEQPRSASIRVIDGAIWGAAADSVGFVSLIRFAVRERR